MREICIAIIIIINLLLAYHYKDQGKHKLKWFFVILNLLWILNMVLYN